MMFMKQRIISHKGVDFETYIDYSIAMLFYRKDGTNVSKRKGRYHSIFHL